MSSVKKSSILKISVLAIFCVFLIFIFLCIFILATTSTTVVNHTNREPTETPYEIPCEPLPILVTAMVHVDPLPTVPNITAILGAYAQHRDGWLWYLDLAKRTGLRLSAQMTGVYAEACLRQGNASDFASCMPGGPHHLGTHLHANIKGPAPYVWETVPPYLHHDPATVAQILAENIPWINAIFDANGFSSVDNWFFHGSFATYPGMDRELFGVSGLPYTNRYLMAGALRGRLYLYRGGFLTEPHQEGTDVSFIKMPEVGGIIGEDRPHGPEGIVYGSVPYQRRDFLRAYIEWREMVRRGDHGPVRHFTWMIHPYQLVQGYVGSDGRSPRVSIEELVNWLRGHFIEKRDDTGQIVARFANVREIRDAFETWERVYPAEAAKLQETMKQNNPPRYSPGILDRMETTFHLDSFHLANGALAVHRLGDRETGATLYLIWACEGREVSLHRLRGFFKKRFLVYRGDGTTEELDSREIQVGDEPVLLEDLGKSKATKRRR